MSSHEHHGMKPLDGLAPYCSRSNYSEHQREDRFGRMFGDLPPAYTRPDILQEIGRDNGPMDGGNKNSPTKTVPVGMVFFGQFIDHDITLDASTSFSSVISDAGEVSNVRTPTLDLDCIYGLGPEAQPYLFSQEAPFNGVKLLTGDDNRLDNGDLVQGEYADHDLLRSPNMRAVIGDPRNDENRILSQMQLAIIRFHNHVADTLYHDSKNNPDEETLEGHDLYEEARKQTTWHYQWAVVNDFLTAMCGTPVVERILGCGRQFYCANTPFIPVEFSVAAYRFGHSMIPMSLQTRKGTGKLELFGEFLGRGFDRVSHARAVVDWHELFETSEGRTVEKTQTLDTKLAGDLLKLPFVEAGGEASLATRNLLRGNAFLLPGGEKVAKAIGVDQSDIDTVIGKVAEIHPGLGSDGIPLWLYLLAEAEVIGRAESNGTFAKGEALGPVGATIVAEVMIGILELDDRSFLGANRNWAPREEWDDIGKIMTITNPTLPAV